MKSAGWQLLFIVVAVSLSAQASPAITAAAPLAKPPDAPFEALAKEGPARTSARLTQEIRSTLPKFVAPAEAKNTPAEPAGPADPDVIVLPTIKVQEQRPPRIESNDLLTSRELNKKFARDYKNSLRGLDAVLNGFSLPIVSPSLAARGRAAYKARKLDELNQGIETIRLADPKTSGELKKEVLEMLKVEVWNNAVTGGK